MASRADGVSGAGRESVLFGQQRLLRDVLADAIGAPRSASSSSPPHSHLWRTTDYVQYTCRCGASYSVAS
jgi:hypothetical protein